MLTDHMGSGKGNGETSGGPNGREAAAEDTGVELSLGLSLNGRFGVDPSKNGPQITRSSSISMFPPLSLDINNQLPAPVVAAPARSHSLPTETQAENWRKRKELQSMRRSEARKRRMEKLKTPTPTPTRAPTPTPTPPPTPRPDEGVNGNGAPPGTLKTMGSQASGSSVLSQLENFPNKVTAAVLGNADQASGSSQPAQGNNEPPQPRCRIPRPRADAAPAEKKAADGRQELQNLMMTMPSVTTIGNGPNGRKVDGLLYKYSRGEEVKILCVCHGSFMSPADFWRHAGGEDVENPLKHIVVSPSLIL